MGAVHFDMCVVAISFAFIFTLIAPILLLLGACNSGKSSSTKLWGPSGARGLQARLHSMLSCMLRMPETLIEAHRLVSFFILIDSLLIIIAIISVSGLPASYYLGRCHSCITSQTPELACFAA
jgi:hypothetical protein